MVVVEKLAPRDPTFTRTWIVIYTGTDGRQLRIDELNSRTGTGMLEITVFPHWQQTENRDPRRTFESGAADGALTHAPDGTSVITETTGVTKSGGGPAVQWGADTLHPDGTRVEISEWNGANGYEFKPGTPALTTDQLKAIATAPAWRG